MRQQRRLICAIAGAAALAAAPVDVDLTEAGWTVKAGYAFAKDGRDDNRGGGSSDGRNDDGGSGGGGDRSEEAHDAADDARDAADDARDAADDARDAADDEDDRTAAGGKVEISRGGIEIEQANGAREEIEDGRYERKDAAGRTIEERRATQADIDRLRGLAGPGVVAATRRVGSGSVARVEISGGGIAIVNNDGTREEIENGRYERKDASGLTIEERPATKAEVDRLQFASRGAGIERRIKVGSVAEVERFAAGVKVVYSTGWKEEFENGRYELKDPNGNTVVERSVTEQDRARMTRLAGG